MNSIQNDLDGKFKTFLMENTRFKQDNMLFLTDIRNNFNTWLESSKKIKS